MQHARLADVLGILPRVTVAVTIQAIMVMRLNLNWSINVLGNYSSSNTFRFAYSIHSFIHSFGSKNSGSVSVAVVRPSFDLFRQGITMTLTP